MAVTRFVPAQGNYGETYVAPTVLLAGSAGLTSGGVRNVLLPTTEDRLWFKGASVSLGGTVPAGTGTLTAQVRKRLVGGAFVDVSEAVNIFGRSAFDKIVLSPLGGISEGSFALQPGEHFVVTFTNTGGTITVQPTDLGLAAKLAVLR